MRPIIFFLIIALCGCQSLNRMKQDLDESFGAYTAPTLAGSPTPSGCSDKRCQILDAIEAKGYELARAEKITWVKLVNTFYQARAEMYPNSRDGNSINEFRTYQRALAEQLDMKKITESQWAYLIARKSSEISAREQALSNSAPRQTQCVTTNTGTTLHPQYSTTCR